jgi:hypothetical protein
MLLLSQVDPYELCVFAAAHTAEQLDKQLFMRRLHLIEKRLALDAKKEEQRSALEQAWAGMFADLSAQVDELIAPAELHQRAAQIDGQSLRAQAAAPTGAGDAEIGSASWRPLGLAEGPTSLADAYAADPHARAPVRQPTRAQPTGAHNHAAAHSRADPRRNSGIACERRTMHSAEKAWRHARTVHA